MRSDWRGLWQRRELLLELVRGELKAVAAETRFGWLWWVLDPLIMMVIYWFFVVILFGRNSYQPYSVFLGCALLPWQHLMTSLRRAMRVLRSSESLIKSVPFPTLLLPVSQTLAQFLYFACGVLALALLAVERDVPMTSKLVQIPALMLCQLGLVAGLALLVAPLGVLVRDIDGFLTHGLRIAFYLSPGLYDLDLVEQQIGHHLGPVWGAFASRLALANPFAILFSGYRAALQSPRWLEPQLWSVLVLETGLALVVGYLVFRHFDRRVIKFI